LKNPLFGDRGNERSVRDALFDNFKELTLLMLLLVVALEFLVVAGGLFRGPLLFVSVTLRLLRLLFFLLSPLLLPPLLIAVMVVAAFLTLFAIFNIFPFHLRLHVLVVFLLSWLGLFLVEHQVPIPPFCACFPPSAYAVVSKTPNL
jgi:hypothetical protein